MKAVILAGGLGTRISEESGVRPKPMIEIGAKPLLWHIMKLYSHHGINEFVVCCGYKGYVIKEYFTHYLSHMSDLTIDLKTNVTEIHNSRTEPWKITLVDTGENTMTGGRLKRVSRYLEDAEDFCMTYGDGVCDVNITQLLTFHKSQGTLATVTAVQPPGRFGALLISGDRASGFQEKPQGDGGWINGGFFVLSPLILDYIEGDTTVWERDPMQRLALEGQLSAYRHLGFWHPVDTLRDKNYLEELWGGQCPPWKVWDANHNYG